jgi:signal transduction histidine kinase
VQVSRNSSSRSRGAIDPDVVEINGAISDVIALASHAMPPRIELPTDIIGEIWPTLADRASLQSALLNLMINARDAMPDGGRITLCPKNLTFEADNLDLTRGDYVRLSVRIPAAV